jgi:hypothetical protein
VVYEIVDTRHKAGDLVDRSPASAHVTAGVGIGLWIALAGAVVALVGGVLALVVARRAETGAR